MPQTDVSDLLAKRQGNILQKLYPFYLSNLSSRVETFYKENYESFVSEDDAPGEHKLEWTGIHREYERLLQGILEDFIEEQGLSESRFMKLLEMSKDKASRREKIMLNIILAQDDYGMFVNVMFREAKRRSADDDDDDDAVSSKVGERSRSK